MKIVFGGFSEENIMTNAGFWSRLEKGARAKSDGSFSSTSSFSPEQFCQSALSDLYSAGAKSVKEKDKGMDTLKYEFGKGTRVNLANALLGDIPEYTRVALWVTEAERRPVTLTIAGDQKGGPDAGAFTLALPMTDLNKNIAINPAK